MAANLTQRWLRLVFGLSAAAGFATGCQEQTERGVFAPPEQADEVPIREEVIGESVEGRPLRIHVVGRGEETMLVVAGIHGNEPAGTPLVEELIERLGEEPERVRGLRVVVFPAANPDGLAQGTRFNVHGVDVNRNFPAANFRASRRNGPQALSEPESRAIYYLLARYAPARIVSLHQPLSCIDYDGPAEALARRMAAVCDLPVRKLGGRPGSLGSYAGITRGIPIVTVELPRSASRLSRAELWSRYGRMLMAFLEGHRNQTSSREL